MKEDRTCPACGKKLKVFYLKPNCPHCGADILRCNMEQRLAQDAEKADAEVQALWRTVRKLDKAHLVEKHYRKKGKPLPWEDAQADSIEPSAVSEENTNEA